jgi:hypothetical protein
MARRRDPLKEALEELERSHQAGRSDSGVEHLRAVIASETGLLVAKAAAVASAWSESSLAADLERSFHRLRTDGPTVDPQCWAKVAVIRALFELAWDEPEVYVAGCRTVQLEPVRGGTEDTAVGVRRRSIRALLQIPVVDPELTSTQLADLLADRDRSVRTEAASVCVYGQPALVAPLLRLKIKVGDADSRVIGTCFDSLLAVKPDDDSVALVQNYCNKGSQPLWAEALGALVSCNLDSAVASVVDLYEELNDEQLRRIVVTAAGTSSTGLARSFLLARLSEPLPEAEWALEALMPKLRPGPELEGVETVLKARDDALLARFNAWRATSSP